MRKIIKKNCKSYFKMKKRKFCDLLLLEYCIGEVKIFNNLNL